MSLPIGWTVYRCSHGIVRKAIADFMRIRFNVHLYDEVAVPGPDLVFDLDYGNESEMAVVSRWLVFLGTDHENENQVAIIHIPCGAWQRVLKQPDVFDTEDALHMSAADDLLDALELSNPGANTYIFYMTYEETDDPDAPITSVRFVNLHDSQDMVLLPKHLEKLVVNDESACSCGPLHQVQSMPFQ